MATEVEEIILNTGPFNLQHILPHGGDCLLQLSAWAYIIVGWLQVMAIQIKERSPVYLPVSCERKAFQQYYHRSHHVLWKALSHVRAQLFDRGFRVLLQNYICFEPLVL